MPDVERGLGGIGAGNELGHKEGDRVRVPPPGHRSLVAFVDWRSARASSLPVSYGAEVEDRGRGSRWRGLLVYVSMGDEERF